ncbi:MAG: hypothetical protein P8M78_17610 [Myxococcota bacterium]|nr:hypothetical protein [Myxococcota bacterium]
MTTRTRSLAIPAGVLLAAIVFALPLIRRGIILSDEGYLLQQSLDLLQGRVIYRDMDAFITPGMWFLLAGLFSVFEPSVVASRYLMLAAFAILSLTAYQIVRPISGLPAALGAVIGLFIFCVWAFPAWTFAFYSPVAILLILLGLERLLAWQRNRSRANLIWVGLWIGLAIAFKQNYGAFALAGAAIGWLATRLDGQSDSGPPLTGATQDAAAVALGGLIAGAPFLLYLALHGALDEAWTSLVVHPFEFAGRHDIPFAPLSDLVQPDVYSDGVEKLTYLSYALLRNGPISFLQDIRGTQRLHVLAYWLPPLLFTAGFLLSAIQGRRSGRRWDSPLLIVTAVCGMTFLGVLPRADYNHLMNVYQPVVITGAIVLASTWSLIPKSLWGARWGFGLVLGSLLVLYGGTSAAWYASIIRSHSIPIEGQRGGILVDRVDGDRVLYLLRTINDHSSSGQPLLTVPDLVMLNFLSDRPVPSAYYNLYEHHIAEDQGAAVVAGAEESGVELVVTNFDNFFSDRVGLLEYAPVLSTYLVENFERLFIDSGQDFIVYRRRESPLPSVEYMNVLDDCTSDDELADTRDHLLFSALYHRSRLRQPIPTEGLETHCRLQVPASGGVLSLELGYLRPTAALPGTQLIAEIQLKQITTTEESGAANAKRSVLYETLRVVPAQTARRQQRFTRFDISLSDWAGQEIEVTFRTRLSGSIAVRSRNWKGFAMVYRDPRVQADANGARP